MALWPVRSWTRWDVPDLLEYSFALAGTGLGVWAALAEHGQKTLPAALAATAGAFTLTAKAVSKHLEKKLKEEKEKQARDVSRVAVKVILDQMREEYFSTEAGDEKYKHRATLFACEGPDSRSGVGKHLAIFARSGVHLDSPRTWPLDDNHPEGCRGVAGKIWYHNITDIKTAECAWPSDDNLLEKARYAESLEITVAEAEKLNVKSRAFAGAPIVVGGRKWGVLLLDSLKDGLIADTPHKKGLLNRYTQLLGRILTETGA